MTYAIVACARNEGAFLVEWLAHHLSIGFDKIFVATNDCEDGTDELLDLLSQDWPIYRIKNGTPFEGKTIQRSGVQRALHHVEMSNDDWVLHIDLDEFLNIQSPTPDIKAFMDGFEPYHAVMLAWRLFGSSNRSFWDGGSVLDGFMMCQNDTVNSAQKAMFRRSVFKDAAPHCPKAPRLPIADLRIVNTAHELLDADICYRNRGTALRIDQSQIVWSGAFVNHYIHKSSDLTQLSLHMRGDANGRPARRKRTAGTPEYEMFNRNDVVDMSIHSNRSARTRMMNLMLKTPGVLEAHYHAHRWFFDRLLDLQHKLA